MRVLIVDDHALIRAGLRQICLELGLEVDEAGNGEDALRLQRTQRINIVLLDLNLPGIGGFDLLRQFLDADPALRILVVSMHADSAYATRAMKAGAFGYLGKDASGDEIRTALKHVMGGCKYMQSSIAQAIAVATDERQLTERDLEVLRMLGDGLSFAEIAARLGVSYKTIANGTTQIRAKLGVRTTSDLIRMSVEMRLPHGK